MFLSFSKFLSCVFGSISNVQSKFLIHCYYCAHFFEHFSNIVCFFGLCIFMGNFFQPLSNFANFCEFFFLFFFCFQFWSRFLLPMPFPCDWLSILSPHSRATQVEPEIFSANALWLAASGARQAEGPHCGYSYTVLLHRIIAAHYMSLSAPVSIAYSRSRTLSLSCSCSGSCFCSRSPPRSFPRSMIRV